MSPRSSTLWTGQPIHSLILAEAQQVAAESPGGALSFTYVNGSAILGATR